MPELNLDDLKGFLLKAVGDDDSIDLSGDILDDSLTALGFDSLAVIDATSRIEQHYGVKLPEGESAEITTPRTFLDAVNRQLRQHA